MHAYKREHSPSHSAGSTTHHPYQHITVHPSPFASTLCLQMSTVIVFAGPSNHTVVPQRNVPVLTQNKLHSTTTHWLLGRCPPFDASRCQLPPSWLDIGSCWYESPTKLPCRRPPEKFSRADIKQSHSTTAHWLLCCWPLHCPSRCQLSSSLLDQATMPSRCGNPEYGGELQTPHEVRNLVIETVYTPAWYLQKETFPHPWTGFGRCQSYSRCFDKSVWSSFSKTWGGEEGSGWYKEAWYSRE